MKDSLRGRNLLSIADLSAAELRFVLDVARSQKESWQVGDRAQVHAGRAIALIFQKPSLRTRVSFEVACARLGIHPVTLAGTDSAFSRGESVYDTTKVLERYVDAIAIRTFEQALIEEIAEHSSVPVMNMLSDDHHPFQGLADLLTVQERVGRLEGVTFAYIGDGNNMATTYLLGGALAGMNVRVGSPAGYHPASDVVERATALAAETGGSVAVFASAVEAVAGAQVVATDTWASMGQEGEHAERVATFAPFAVDRDLMSEAAGDAIFMHCLPAHRGEEVIDEVMDDPCSVVFDEAENRLHVQKAWLSLVLGV